jgi:hypothetical protein
MQVIKLWLNNQRVGSLLLKLFFLFENIKSTSHVEWGYCYSCRHCCTTFFFVTDGGARQVGYGYSNIKSSMLRHSLL